MTRVAELRRYQNFVDGRFVDAEAGRLITVENPSTGQVISQVPDSSVEDTREAIHAAERAQRDWERLSPVDRAEYLHQIAAVLRRDRDRHARVISEEQGKTLDLALASVDVTCAFFDYNAEWARRLEGEIATSDRADEVMLLFHQPIGVIGGIVAWNFPLAILARKTAPALVTGNTIVIKPSSLTPNNAAEFAKVVAEAGLPPGVFNLVCGSGGVVGNELASNPAIGMVSLTGSVETGSRIMEAASRNLIKVNLELGGSAPAIVMADADLDIAVTAIKLSRVQNTGQVCNCADRVYVDKRIADEFTDRFTKAMAETTYGDPLVDAGIEMGPLVSREQLEDVDRRVKRAIRDGATLLTGGTRDEKRPEGYFYPATVLADCRQDMAIVREEIFGPVMPIVTFSDFDEAIALANDSVYGLTSSIYTRNLDVAMRACREIKFGETYINRENGESIQGFHAGWRKSGLGGADGKHGIYENMKTHLVYLRYDTSADGR
ncbi:MAG: aldehyde dehydrogenase [Candidatus Limnocylindrales bacterium]|jgi:lactaldehyde dehydrogenase/glycolaldehyde dehydrogenase